MPRWLSNPLLALHPIAAQVISSECRATVGQVSGGGRTEKPMLKAGRSYHKFRVKRNSWPKVRRRAAAARPLLPAPRAAAAEDPACMHAAAPAYPSLRTACTPHWLARNPPWPNPLSDRRCVVWP